MREKPRVVFVYCYEDPWIAPIAGDLHAATNSLGYELFVIGGGKNDSIDKERYVDLDNLKFSSLFYKSFKFAFTKSVDLTELVNREAKLFENRPNVFYKEEYQKIFNLWFTDATIIYKIIQPDIVIVWNGLFAKRVAYAHAAKQLHLPVYYAEKGMFPNSWYIDSKGINALSIVAEDRPNIEISEEAVGKWKSKLNMINKKGDSAWEQPVRTDTDALREKLGIKPGQKVIFFPGQVDSDSNIILFSPEFKTVVKALDWLAKDLPENEYFILAKPHPKGDATVDDFQKIIGNRGKATLDLNVLDAIELADCIVSINSTVAFEAAIRGKPVLMLGQGVLSNKRFACKYVSSEDSYQQVKLCIEDYKKSKQDLHNEATAFAAYLDSEYYTYKQDIPKTINMLRDIHSADNEKEKIFKIDEISNFFNNESNKQFPSKMETSVLLNNMSGRRKT